MMKTRKQLLIICLAAAMLLAACGAAIDAPTVPEKTPAETSLPADGGHRHILANAEFDTEEHRGTCECGEDIHEPHSFEETNQCDICGISLSRYSGGSTILTFDQWGSPLTVTEYDTAGNKFYETLYTYEYYDEGTPKSAHAQYSDGTTSVVQYDANGNILSCIFYDPEGSVTSEETYTYELDEAGRQIQIQSFQADGYSSVSRVDADGNVLSEMYRIYDDEGNLYVEEAFEYEQDEDGNLIKVMTTRSDDFHYLEKQDQDGHCLYYASYDGDGNLDGETIYEYERDNNGNILGGTSCYYDDGELKQKAELFMSPGGEILSSSEVHYYEDIDLAQTFTFEYEFADTGEVIYKCRLIGTFKDCEYFYEYDSYSESYYLARDIVHMDTYSIESLYTPDYQLKEQIWYDAEGNEIEPLE